MAGSVAEVTDNSFETDVLQSETPVLVDFWAPWCMPCKLLSPIVDKVATSLGGQLKVVKINVDDNQSTAINYRVQSIPTLIWFKNGEVVDQYVGRLEEDALRSKCLAVIG